MQQLDLKDKIREWWNDPSQDYDGFHGHGVNSDIEKELWGDEIMRILNSKRDPKVLDIGTGTGFLALLLARMGYNVTGADWAVSKISQAKDKARAAEIAVQFRVEDAEKLTLESSAFDAVVSRHVLWTLSDPYAAAREWVRVTKTGGRVIVDIPRMGSHSGSHHFGAEIGRNLPFYNGADPEEVEAMLKGAGLINIGTLMLETAGEEEKKTLLVYGEKA